jgi:hypothetical protein
VLAIRITKVLAKVLFIEEYVDEHTTNLLAKPPAFTFLTPDTFAVLDFWLEAMGLVPDGGRQTITYTTWSILNGRRSVYNDRTGFSTVDWNRNM